MSIKSDLLEILQKHPGSSTAEVADKMESISYYKNMRSHQEILNDVVKRLDKLRHDGLLTAEKRISVPGHRSKNHWTVIPPKHEEMASDMAELAIPAKPVLPTSEDAAMKEVMSLISADTKADELAAYNDGFRAVIPVCSKLFPRK